jgi:ADP-dependent phosphofructokinase/glucokinase
MIGNPCACNCSHLATRNVEAFVIHSTCQYALSLCSSHRPAVYIALRHEIPFPAAAAAARAVNQYVEMDSAEKCGKGEKPMMTSRPGRFIKHKQRLEQGFLCAFFLE